MSVVLYGFALNSDLLFDSYWHAILIATGMLLI